MRSHRYFAALAWMTLSLVGFGIATAHADEPAPTFEGLSRQIRDAYTNGDYKKAIALSEKQLKLRPNATDPLYNIACMNCLLGNKAECYEWLEKALAAGYADADHMVNDYDLRTIWGESRFRSMIQKLRDKDSDSSANNGAAKKNADDKPKDESRTEDTPRRRPNRAAQNDRTRTQKVQELTRQVIEASEAKEHDKALRLAKDALDVADIGLTNYNVACMYSLLGKTDEAFEYLDRCVARGGMGGDLVAQIEGDSDLDSLRKDKRYDPLLRRAKHAGQGERVEFKWRVVAPKNHDKTKKSPLLVALHPFGGNMDSTVDRWREAAEEVGAVMVCPQGTLKMGGDAHQWGFDTTEIEKNIMRAMDAAMDDFAIDQNKIVLAGFSQGGWITWHLGLSHPDTFHGLIPVGGMYRKVSGSSATPRDLKKIRVFVMVGENEREDVVDSNREAVSSLEKLGAKTKLNVYDGVGHDFPDNANEEQIKALKFVLSE